MSLSSLSLLLWAVAVGCYGVEVVVVVVMGGDGVGGHRSLSSPVVAIAM